MAPTTPSSPYGLEAHRVALLRRRRQLLLAAVLAGVLALVAVVVLTLNENGDVSTLSGGQGSNTIDIAIPDKPRPKPTTLSIAPGRTTVLDKPIQPEVRAPSTEPPEQINGRGGLNWMGILQTFGPTLGVGLYAWRYGRKRMLSSLEEVNLGVYKGALPFELHAAKHKKFLFTSKMAMAPVFGKAPIVPVRVLPPPTRFQRVG